jgi:hypothetical protein
LMDVVLKAPYGLLSCGALLLVFHGASYNDLRQIRKLPISDIPLQGMVFLL